MPNRLCVALWRSLLLFVVYLNRSANVFDGTCIARMCLMSGMFDDVRRTSSSDSLGYLIRNVWHRFGPLNVPALPTQKERYSIVSRFVENRLWSSGHPNPNPQPSTKSRKRSNLGRFWLLTQSRHDAWFLVLNSESTSNLEALTYATSFSWFVGWIARWYRKWFFFAKYEHKSINIRIFDPLEYNRRIPWEPCWIQYAKAAEFDVDSEFGIRNQVSCRYFWVLSQKSSKLANFRDSALGLGLWLGSRWAKLNFRVDFHQICLLWYVYRFTWAK